MITFLSKHLHIDFAFVSGSLFWLGVRQACAAGMGLAFTISLARTLPPNDFGVFILVTTITSLVGIVTLPGVNDAITHAVAKGRDKTYDPVLKHVYKRVVVLALVAGLMAGGVVLIFKNIPLWVVFIAVTFPFSVNLNLWEQFLIAKEKIRQASIAGVIQSVLGFGGVICIILVFRTSLYPTLTLYFLIFGVVNSGFVFWSRRFIEDSKVDTSVVQEGTYLTFIHGIQLFARNTDKLLLGLFISPAVLSTYYLCTSFLFNAQLSIRQILFFANRRLVSLKTMTLTHWGMLVSLGIFITIPAFFFSDDLLLFFYGDTYSEVAGYAPVASLSLIFSGMNDFVYRWLMYRKERRMFTSITILRPLIIWVLQIAAFVITGSIVGLIVVFVITPLVELMVSLSIRRYFWRD